MCVNIYMHLSCAPCARVEAVVASLCYKQRAVLNKQSQHLFQSVNSESSLKERSSVVK